MNKNDSSVTNHVPPTHAQCPECMWDPDWYNGGEGNTALMVCPNCAGTGLALIPIPEVISGLRRGGIVPSKAEIWNKWPKEGQ